MALRLREADDFPNARVAGWESRDGRYHTTYDTEMNKVGRNPTDHSLESAHRVILNWDGDFYTIGALTPDYDLEDAIHDLQDYYGSK